LPERAVSTRCSCGEHDLPDGVQRPCHFCGHATVCPPIVDWTLGRLYYPICHRCVWVVDFESLSVLVHQAPEVMLADAQAFGKTPIEGAS
jgi:hypothetical protein